MLDVRIRAAIASDFEDIVSLNAEAVRHTSAMDLERLRHLDELSSYHVVAEAGGSVAGFLLAMRDGCAYENDNYAWFSARFPAFLYIDRVVVDADARGLGIGNSLYGGLFEFADAINVATIACEYNLIPPNAASRAFHRKYGFRELGTRWLNKRTRRVSMQVLSLDDPAVKEQATADQ